VSLLVELNGKKMVVISFEVDSPVTLPFFPIYQLFCLGGVIVGEDVGSVVDELVGFVVGLDVGLVVDADAGCCAVRRI